MSEFELIESITNASTVAGASAMNVVAVLFAYVLAAHFVGKQLPRSIAVFMSLLYSLFLIVPTSVMISAGVRVARLIARYRDEFPDVDLYPITPSVGMVLAMAVVPLVLGWVGSLYFMHGYVRCKG